MSKLKIHLLKNIRQFKDIKNSHTIYSKFFNFLFQLKTKNKLILTFTQ